MKQILIGLLLMAGNVFAAELKVAKIFADGMVLQQKAEVPVWGMAEPGVAVTVAFADQKKTGKADENGKWMVKLEPMKASSESRELRISSNHQSEIQ